MAMTDEDRASYAASVPAYVVAADDGTWRAMDTASGEVLSVEHASARAALESVRDKVAAKRAVLRTDGEPDGAWRWLDATAEEDEPIADVRIGERACWDIASKLNERSSARPINGGELPPEWTRSMPHGDAKSGDGSHPANGWAHAGFPVVDEAGRTHTYLWSELLPEVARDVDRGRLAFGSVFIAFDGVDPDDNHAVIGAELISHALTNDQAVDPLTAGSERQTPTDGRRAVRTRSLSMADKKTTRGPATDKLKELLLALGVEWSDEMEGDSWMSPAMDRISALKSAAVVEEIVEGGKAPAGDEAAAERAARANEDEEEEAEAAREMSPEDAEAFAESAAPLLAQVFAKPDASPMDLLAELEARAEEMAALLAEEPAEEPAEEEPEAEGGEESAERSRERGAALARETARADKAEAIAREAQDKVARFEMRDQLDEALAARGLAMSTEDHAQWTNIGLRNGWDLVEAHLKGLTAPPVGEHPIARSRQRGPTPSSLVEATNALEGAAREALRSERGTDADLPRHLVIARAERMARAEYPELG